MSPQANRIAETFARLEDALAEVDDRELRGTLYARLKPLTEKRLRAVAADFATLLHFAEKK